MSEEQTKYIKKIKLKKRIILLSQILIMLIFLILWQMLSNKNIIDSFITSSPKNIIKTIIELYKNKNLFIHIFITLKETIIALIITTIVSLLIAIILYNNDLIAKIIEPYFMVLNSLPKVALGPLLIIWIGANTKTIIIIGILISIIISIQNIYNGFKQTDKSKIKLMKTFNATELSILLNVVLPYNKENIINTTKINISMCLIGVITGEFLVSKAGIGYLIIYGTQIFNLDLVMSSIIILLFISTLLYILTTKK